MIPTVIEDPNSGNVAQVTKFGQLVVSVLDYSIPSQDAINVVNQAFNFIAPVAGKSIVITDILLQTDRNSGVNGTVIDVYEATGAAELTILEEILQSDLTRQATRDLTSLNLIVPEGRWVNVKADDTNVLVTIMFYRVPTKV